jgi:hypothetical protein
LEKEPERRYQHASEVGEDVETIRSDKQSKARFFPGGKAGDDVTSIRHRVWIPAVGLLIVGVIYCLSVIGALLHAIMPGTEGLFAALLVAAHALIIIYGAWNLMQLRSYRWAVAGSILGMITPAFIIGLPMGIWAMWLLRKKEVRAVFGQQETEFEIPPKIRNFTVSAVKDVRTVYGRGKAEVQKIIHETTPDLEESQKIDVTNPRKSLGIAISSSALGLVSTIILSIDMSYPLKFTLGILSIVFAGFLGVIAIKNIQNYRKHLVETGFAIMGILFALISIIRLLVII